MEFLIVLLLAIGLVGIAFLGFALNILIKKKGAFPETSISKNKAMQERGISCVKHEEYKCSGIGAQGGCCGGK